MGITDLNQQKGTVYGSTVVGGNAMFLEAGSRGDHWRDSSIFCQKRHKKISVVILEMEVTRVSNPVARPKPGSGDGVQYKG